MSALGEPRWLGLEKLNRFSEATSSRIIGESLLRRQHRPAAPAKLCGWSHSMFARLPNRELGPPGATQSTNGSEFESRLGGADIPARPRR